MLVTPQGDVYAANLFDESIPVTARAGDFSLGWTFVVKAKTAREPGFVLQLGGSYPADALAQDASGNLYVEGEATASGLPVTPGAFLATPGGDHSPYVCKLDRTKGTVVYCTYLGDSPIYIAAMSVDSSGNVYIAAQRNASLVEATPGALSLGNRQVIVMKLDPTGTKLLYRAEFGENVSDSPAGLAVDSDGNVYVAGSATKDGQAVPFVTKIDPQGARIIYTSYGSVGEAVVPSGIAVDASGSVHLVLWSGAGLSVRKYNSNGSGIVYDKPVIPGNARDVSSQIPIAIDETGVATLAASTTAIGLPVHNTTANCAAPGGPNGYLVRLSPDGELLQTTYLAATGPFVPSAIAAQVDGGYVAGSFSTQSSVLRIVPDASAATTAIGCYGNGADFVGGPLAPGEIFSIFGEGLGPAEPTSFQWDENQRIGPSLGGVSVTLDGVPAPLLYVHQTQINAIAPWGIAGKTSVRLCTSYNDNESCTTVAVAPAAPGIFRYTDSGNVSHLAVVNEDGTLNSPTAPAPAGSVIAVYLTGLGSLTPARVDGSIVGLPLPQLDAEVHAGSSDIDFHKPILIPTDVLYAGPAPLEIGGLYQVNVRVPSETGGAITIHVRTSDGHHVCGRWIHVRRQVTPDAIVRGPARAPSCACAG